MKWFFFFITFCFSISANAQKIDKRLQSSVKALISDFHGQAGVYIHDLKKNKIVSIHADSVFPTASMVKIPILVGIMNKIDKGELQYHQELTYKDS